MTIPAKWGFCFSGNEAAFVHALEVAAKARCTRGDDGPFDYLEVGIGHGGTMKAVAAVLAQLGIPWRVVGVDLPEYGGNAINEAEMGCGVRVCGPLEAAGQEAGSVSVCLSGSEAFLAASGQRWDFVFIDACHGRACVTREFLQVEPKVKRGGVVAFHDTDPFCQGQYFQPHCKEGIAARAAVDSLGLLDDGRLGWFKLLETTGNHAAGGHGSLFVQKVMGGN